MEKMYTNVDATQTGSVRNTNATPLKFLYIFTSSRKLACFELQPYVNFLCPLLAFYDTTEFTLHQRNQNWKGKKSKRVERGCPRCSLFFCSNHPALTSLRHDIVCERMTRPSFHQNPVTACIHIPRDLH